MGASRVLSFHPIVAIAAAILVVATSGNFISQGGIDLLQRSRQLTRYLYAGTVDSLPTAALLDLGGTGDTVLVRWFLGNQRDSLGREWPTKPMLTLVGPKAAADFLARLEAMYGRELAVVDEGIYPCYHPLCEFRHSVEYNANCSLLSKPRSYRHDCVAMDERKTRRRVAHPIATGGAVRPRGL
jgi:hypothetical protein